MIRRLSARSVILFLKLRQVEDAKILSNKSCDYGLGKKVILRAGLLIYPTLKKKTKIAQSTLCTKTRTIAFSYYVKLSLLNHSCTIIITP